MRSPRAAASVRAMDALRISSGAVSPCAGQDAMHGVVSSLRCDADLGLQRDVDLLQRNAGGKDVVDAFGDDVRRVHVGVVQYQQELAGADVPQRFAGAKVHQQRARRLREYFIARVQTKDRGDRIEPPQFDREHADVRLVTGAQRQRLVQAFRDTVAVRQVCHRIVSRLVRDPRLTFGYCGAHRVEARREFAELVVGPDLDRAQVVTRADASRCGGQDLHRLRDTAGHVGGADGAAQQQRDAEQDQFFARGIVGLHRFLQRSLQHHVHRTVTVDERHLQGEPVAGVRGDDVNRLQAFVETCQLRGCERFVARQQPMS